MTTFFTLNSSANHLMGILNVTPDSFSDGGDYLNSDAAVQHAVDMSKQGADIIDIGGESTRPGSKRVSEQNQKDRILEIISKVSTSLPDTMISVDTTRSRVAEAALQMGANMLNDISAGREDPEILALAADAKVPICLMHMQGEPTTMQDKPHYQDIVSEVCTFLEERASVAIHAGIAANQIILDPGIGFGKTSEHNLVLLAHLKQIVSLGFPVLLGTSRKRFIGTITEEENPKQRIIGSCVTTALGVLAGVRIFRVHDVAAHKQALDVVWAIEKCS